MRRNRKATEALAERMCRPQRIGVFGHRGVGKTTFLTMLYREAVAGRLPELRLAAANARTAGYLADKIVQLESGQTLPATLAETELHFHLYHRGARLDLLVKDYQGEQVELGRQGPIQDFLNDCDAVWLCLDAAALGLPADCLKRQQEVEQLLETFLADGPRTRLTQPIALLLTKSDLVSSERVDSVQQANGPCAMTQHALAVHCPSSAHFAVSSLGTENEAESGPRILQPRNLEEPLAWLAQALQAQDEARMERLFSSPSTDISQLKRSVACLVHRYPQSPATAVYQQRLREIRRRVRRRWTAVAAVAAASVLTVLLSYDALGYYKATRFEADHSSDPVATLEQWQSYQAWHPTRHLFQPVSARAEHEHLNILSEQARRFQHDRALADLLRRGSDPDSDAEAAWRQFLELHADYPEVAGSDELAKFRHKLKARRDEQLRRRSQLELDRLTRAEHDGVNLSVLVAQADQFLRDYSDSSLAGEVRERRTAYLRRLEEHEIEIARNYSSRQPFNFQTRREHFQHYLDKHPRGVFAAEAAAALDAIEKDWDKEDFRTLRDHFLAHPGETSEVVARCRSYLAVHPHGQFTAAAADLLRWTERVTGTGEYRVILRSGQFENKIAHFFSRGPDLSVEIEVAGVRYGPSNIVVNRYDPDWDYEFPRRIRWKLGDSVRIRVYDHDYWKRLVVDISSEGGDPLAMRLLAGEAWSGSNHLTFESDFSMPVLPKIE